MKCSKVTGFSSGFLTRQFLPVLTALIVPGLLAGQLVASDQGNAKELVGAAMDHWRGLSSYSEMTMTIHRTDWERSMSMRAWSEGDKVSLVRVTDPKKDAGNGTLLKDNDMWSFSPKINRIIKIPSSMMNQGWMGSDFSNRDISKSTDILDQYEHSLIEQKQLDEHTVYTIESVPHEDAAVVWGKKVLMIRDDFVLLEEQYWDQDGVMVKAMRAREIVEMGGRTVARVIRMSKLETPQEWTEMEVSAIEFDLELPKGIFTLSSLRNPRQ